MPFVVLQEFKIEGDRPLHHELRLRQPTHWDGHEPSGRNDHSHSRMG